MIPTSSADFSWLDVLETGSFVLGHHAALKHHFGNIVASRALQLGILGTKNIEGSHVVSIRGREIMASLFIPQMFEVVVKELKDSHSSLTTTHTNSVDPMDGGQVYRVGSLI